jgi:hypothetical protein
MGRKEKIVFLLVCVFMFLVSFKPVTSYDTFFGLKIGEQIIKTGQIPSTEVFSWSAQGRSWIAYEWLGQSFIYLLSRIGSIGLISFYVAGITLITFIIAFLLSYKTRKNSFLLSVFSSFFLMSVLYEFFVARPQIIGFISFLAFVFLIFDYVFRGKNRLWLTLPILYIWTNSHASFILGILLLFGFGFSAFIYHFMQNETKKARGVLRILAGFGVLGIFITLLPPLFGKPYLLLWQFFTDMGFMTTFVSEWQKLYLTPLYFYFYLLLCILTLTLVVYVGIRDRKNRLWILLSPLFIIVLFSFSALRHYPLGIMAIYCILVSYKIKFGKLLELGILGLLGALGVFFILQNGRMRFLKIGQCQPGLFRFCSRIKSKAICITILRWADIYFISYILNTKFFMTAGRIFITVMKCGIIGN